MIETLNIIILEKNKKTSVKRSDFVLEIPTFAGYAAKTQGCFKTAHGPCEFKIEMEGRYALICLKLNHKAAVFGVMAWEENHGFILWEKFLSIYRATHKTKKEIKQPKSPFLAMTFSPAYLASTSLQEQTEIQTLVQAAAFGIVEQRRQLATLN